MIDALGCVLTWLEAIPQEHHENGQEPPRKRARLDLEKDRYNAEKPRHLPTPSVASARASEKTYTVTKRSLDSHGTTEMPASPKRRRRGDGDDGSVGQQPDSTPRPRKRPLVPADTLESVSVGGSSRQSVYSCASSGVSRNSFPRKQLRNASLQSTGFRGHQPDSTPRPRKRPLVPADTLESVSVGGSSRQSVYSCASSGVSRNSFPRKQLRNASLQSTGFRLASFAMDDARLPASLRELCHDLERIHSGVVILPEWLRSELEAFRVPVTITFADNDETNSLRYPPLDFVRRVLKRAVECDMDCEGESSWNVDVHGPLLDWVLRKDPNRLLVDFRCWSACSFASSALWLLCPFAFSLPLCICILCPFAFSAPLHSLPLCILCPFAFSAPLPSLVPPIDKPEYHSTSAGLIHEYKPKDAPSKMVDFCLAIRPNEEEQQAIDHLCRRRPGLSINHTEWGNLTRHPIAISIETKHQGGDSAVALLQMATWHSAQWRSLRWGNPEQGNLEFLPGILVQGHDWKFVATTLGEDGMATTFKSLQLGNTESIPDIYKLAVSLQRLKHWAEYEYWPAFKADVLGL
ncbi:hypothetical protein OCS_04967 [Ophiocordyceps sinensis CO18]|uniref:PD-(D/E)XK nuclease-like domain-containing protein n=1 Tax=Ophiocordyceps sinensis (strain Co18 / CGMCC 3.14243) TaxID=911162 RepID=T5AA76_OPHSC|nr:hypothetical protein OCS_04967 [Ophiocordyceps sinensis CO18]